MEYSIKSEDSKEEVVYQLLCMGCLCGGRTTKTLTDPALMKYYENILSTVSLSGVLAPRLCWDCVALLKKAFFFTQQVRECFAILQPSLLDMGTGDLTACLSSGVCRAPRLQTCPVSTVTMPTTGLAPNDSEGLAPGDSESPMEEMIQRDVKKEYDADPISLDIKEEVSDVAVEPTSEIESSEASDSTVHMRTRTSNNDLHTYFYTNDLGVQKAVAVPSQEFDTPFKGIKAIYYPRIEAKTGQKGRISLMKATPLGKVDVMASRTISETKLFGTASRTISSLKLDGTSTRTIPPLKLDGTATRTIPSLKLDGTVTRTIPSLKLDGTVTRTIPSLKLDGTVTRTIPSLKLDGTVTRTIPSLKLDGTVNITIPSLKLDGTVTRTIPSLKLDGTVTRTIPSLKLDGTVTRTIPSLKLDGTVTRTIPSLKLDGTVTRTIPSLKLDGTATKTMPSLKLDGTVTRTIPSLKLDGTATRTMPSLKLSQHFKERHEHRSLLRYECQESGPTGNYQPGSSLPFKVNGTAPYASYQCWQTQCCLPMQPQTEPSTQPAGVGKPARARQRAYRERMKALKKKGKVTEQVQSYGRCADTDSGRRLRADLSSLR